VLQTLFHILRLSSFLTGENDMKSNLRLIIAQLCIMQIFAHYVSAAESQQSWWQWLSGSKQAQVDCTGTIKEQLCRILKNLNQCCSELNTDVDELIAKFPCNGFTPISSIPATGYIITNPGKYCVTADLVSSGGGAAIEIASDNVLLDFDFHTLTVSSGTGILIDPNSNIIIKNPVINLATTDRGISGNSSVNVLIYRPLISSGNIAIELSSCSDVTIVEPTIAGSSNCLVDNSGSNIIITDGNLSSTLACVQYMSTTNGKINGTTINSSTDDGVAAILATNLAIKKCFLSGNQGVQFDSATNAVVDSCDIEGTSTGVGFSSGNSNVLVANSAISGSSFAGVAFAAGALDSSIVNCEVTSNATGILVQGLVGAPAKGIAIIGCTQRSNTTPINIDANSAPFTLVKDSNNFNNSNPPAYHGAQQVNNLDF
jgi:hypothetical protein